MERNPLDEEAVVFSEIIETKNKDMNRAINSELVMLFWKIGKILIIPRNNKAESAIIPEASVVNISQSLTDLYGSFFVADEVLKMKLFAEHFPELSLVKTISAILSWPHILLLLNVEDYESKCWYIDQAVRNGWSAEDLENAIKEPHSQKILFPCKATADKWYSEILRLGLQQQSQDVMQLHEILQGEQSASLLKLFMSENNSQDMLRDNEPLASVSILLSELADEIEKFKRFLNWWLNGYLNISFREIGQLLATHLISIKDHEDRSNFIGTISKKLTQKFGSNFTDEQLVKMRCFALDLPDPVADRIVYLVSWEQLQVIMSLQSPESMLFYAKLAANKGLTSSELIELVENDRRRIVPEDQTEKKINIPVLRSESIVKKTGKASSLEVETILIEEDLLKDIVVKNIFQNKYFPLIKV